MAVHFHQDIPCRLLPQPFLLYLLTLDVAQERGLADVRLTHHSRALAVAQAGEQSAQFSLAVDVSLN